MKTRMSSHDADAAEMAGFSTVDEKGRVSLPKALRASLGVHAGSSLAYIMVDHAVLLIPQDDHLAQLQQRAIAALAEVGLSVEDLLERLPEARAAVAQEAYSPEFLKQLRHMREALRAETDAGAAQEERAEQPEQGE